MCKAQANRPIIDASDIDAIMAEIGRGARSVSTTSGREVTSSDSKRPAPGKRQQETFIMTRRQASKANYTPVRCRYSRALAMSGRALSVLLICALARPSLQLPAEQQAHNKSLAQVLHNRTDLVLIASSTPASQAAGSGEPAARQGAASESQARPDASERAARVSSHASGAKRARQQDPIDQLSTGQSVSFADPRESPVAYSSSAVAPAQAASAPTKDFRQVSLSFPISHRAFV